MFTRFINDESGQGITEYAAILAFVAVLIGAFFVAGGTLQQGITNCMTQISSALNAIGS